MTEVVALNIAAGEDFVTALRRVWDAGDCALPLDPRLPKAWRSTLIESLKPTSIVEADLQQRSLDGQAAEAGDAVVIATSGTTGTPKGVVLTRDALEFAAYASMSYMGFSADCTWLGCLPLHHVGGFSVVSRAIVCETGLVLHPRFDPLEVEAAALAGATHVSLVPTTMARIDPALFDRILLGGSAIPSERPANVIATYGMTESGAGVIYDGLALNGVGVQIGHDGEISLSGPSMLRCYRDGTDPKDAAGWYRTGDIGSVDTETGLLTVHGRSDDMIITGGENVWPDPVERLLITHPGVADVAVIGEPDEEWGQRVVAVIVSTGAADATNTPLLEELRDLVSIDLPRWCAPRELRVVDTIPRTALGKISRTALRTNSQRSRIQGT